MTNLGSRTSAVILAAGTSKRMGAVKQLLRLDDRPLLMTTRALCVLISRRIASSEAPYTRTTSLTPEGRT